MRNLSDYLEILDRHDRLARVEAVGRVVALHRGSDHAGSARIQPRVWAFLGLMLALLLVGTLQVDLLTRSYGDLLIPVEGVERLQATLHRWVPYDASRGEEGVTVQGLGLIGLLVLIGGASWFGLNRVDEGYHSWTWVALGLIALTLAAAALGMAPTPDGLMVSFTGKFFGVLAAMAGLSYVWTRYLDSHEVQEWLWETWRFVKQIFPLLVVGVFAVGAIRVLIRPEWIQILAGRNTVLANLVGVLFGVFMYFPTLVEVPIANMFLSLGMHRGPLLAYLMADPELSLQSILITSSVIGKGKAWVYVGWVTLFSTLAGLIYGAWVNGTSLWLLAAMVLAGVGLLMLALTRLSARAERRASREAVTVE